MKLTIEATQDIQADIKRLDAAIDWVERAWGASTDCCQIAVI